ISLSPLSSGGFCAGTRTFLEVEGSEEPMKRQSVDVGRKHQNPIPNASRIGSLVMSSVIIGTDPEHNQLPASRSEQCANMFKNVRIPAERAGGPVGANPP